MDAMKTNMDSVNTFLVNHQKMYRLALGQVKELEKISSQAERGDGSSTASGNQKRGK